MRWDDLVTRQPRLAAFAEDRLVRPGVLLVVTLRKDGTARLSPVEPWLMEGDLWLAMLWQSRKAADLARDPRVLVHSIITGREGAEGEVKLRGTALPERDPSVQSRYAEQVSAALGWSPVVGRFHLFRVDVAEVTVIRYDEPTGDQSVARWPAGTGGTGTEFVRRGTTATSLGDEEPLRDLLT
jgi:hypothetical protein